jgi:ABC-type Na+ transport system ATPase subunit NatA
MQKEIEVNGKKIIVRELLGIETDDINWDDKKESLKKQVMLSTGMDEIIYNALTVKERLKIVQTINDINGFSELKDFQ